MSEPNFRPKTLKIGAKPLWDALNGSNGAVNVLSECKSAEVPLTVKAINDIADWIGTVAQGHRAHFVAGVSALLLDELPFSPDAKELRALIGRIENVSKKMAELVELTHLSPIANFRLSDALEMTLEAKGFFENDLKQKLTKKVPDQYDFNGVGLLLTLLIQADKDKKKEKIYIREFRKGSFENSKKKKATDEKYQANPFRLVVNLCVALGFPKREEALRKALERQSLTWKGTQK